MYIRTTLAATNLKEFLILNPNSNNLEISQRACEYRTQKKHDPKEKSRSNMSSQAIQENPRLQQAKAPLEKSRSRHEQSEFPQD